MAFLLPLRVLLRRVARAARARAQRDREMVKRTHALPRIKRACEFSLGQFLSTVLSVGSLSLSKLHFFVSCHVHGNQAAWSRPPTAAYPSA